MPKFMNSRYYFSKLDLQLFADDGGDDAGDDAGDGDDQDDDDDDGSDEGGEGERKYTQADMDKAVARTIAKERAKAERAAKRKEKQSSSGNKDKDDGESEDARARKEAEGKASRLEVKVACFEAGVDKDSVDDVAALAHSYMDADEDLDLEDAIEKVVKKYPQFKKDAAASDDDDDAGKTKGKAWGERQRSSGKKLTGVEAAFLRKNPGLKY